MREEIVNNKEIKIGEGVYQLAYIDLKKKTKRVQKTNKILKDNIDKVLKIVDGSDGLTTEQCRMISTILRDVR